MYVTQKVTSWTVEVSTLAAVTATRPHDAYSPIIHRMIVHWMHVLRTITNICPLFKLLDDAIRLKLHWP